MWKINGTQIQSPDTKSILPSTQAADIRVVSGANSRDYIGAEKDFISCEWQHMEVTYFNILKAFYDAQRTLGTAMTLTVDELGINFNVIIDFQDYNFPIANSYEYSDLKCNFVQI